MESVRVFLPCTLPRLREALRTGEAESPLLRACAVTPSLREWYSEGDLEELEYVALMDAARMSLALLDRELVANPGAPRRRVVLAADVPAVSVEWSVGERTGVADEGEGEPDRSVVGLRQPIPMSAVVSAHVDDAEAEDAVAAAAASFVAAGLGSEDARFVVDEAEGHELLWWHPSELALLVLDLG